jgi:CRP-like cAMP-binding protein
MSDENQEQGNQKFVELIRQLIPISEIATQGQTEIFNSGNLLKLSKKGTLFEQGARDNFSYYLLEGEIELHANKQAQNTINAGTDRALYAMAQLQPRQFSAKAKTDCVIFQIQRDVVDRQMVLQEQEDTASGLNMDDQSADMEVGSMEDEEDVDWMTRMLQSDLFANMPTANIGQLFALLEEVEYKSGDVVIKQGDPGDKYYIIAGGKCNVLRTPPSGGKDIKLAVLGVGDSFGEEALITESIRNATINMATDGILMQLSKENFDELIKNPTLQSVSYEEATGLIEAGGAWLDVRIKKEHESHAIADSLHIPLSILRMQAEKLEQDRKYIVYCDTGGRSSTAAFLLAERGFDVSYLEGGIVNNPDAADKSEVTQVPPPKPPAEETPPPEVKAEQKPKPKEEVKPDDVDVIEEISKQNLDPDVKASILEAELGKKNMQIEEAEKAKKEADETKKAAQAEVELQLQKDRERIELAKKQAEEEALKIRQNEEEKVKRMQAEAEKRMDEEKQKLEEVYNRNAEEMEKIEQMKQEAESLVVKERERLAEAAEVAKQQMEEAIALKVEMEASLKKEAAESKQQLQEAEALKKEMEASRQKVVDETNQQLQEAEALKNEMEVMRQQQTDEANKKMEEAERMKAEVEASRVAMEQAAEEQRIKQQEMEQQIQQAAKIKLEEERRKLTEEFARNNEDLENAKRERAAAEAARQAAKDEAEKIVAEYKMTHDQSHAEQEAKIRAERMALEEEQKKIQITLLEVKKIKEEAEAAKQAAMQEIELLRAKQNDAEVTSTKVQQDSIVEELKQAEQKASKAAVEIVQAQQAQVKAVAAKTVNEVDLQKKVKLEEELRKKTDADLSEFRHERNAEEKTYDTNTIIEKMKRIKESAEAAKKDAKSQNENLLGDIAAQLGDDE